MGLLAFYLSHGLAQVCEIELSHMGTNNESPDLVCEENMNKISMMKIPIIVLKNITVIPYFRSSTPAGPAWP